MTENIYLSGGGLSPCSRLMIILQDPIVTEKSGCQTIKIVTERIARSQSGAVIGVGEFTEVVAYIIERMQNIPNSNCQTMYRYLFAMLTDLDPRKSQTMETVAREVLLDDGVVRDGDPSVMARAVLMPLVV